MPSARHTHRAPIAILVALLLSLRAGADEETTYEIDPIVVTAGRLPSSFSDRTRAVTIIGRAEIARSPATNVADLLEQAIGVDVRQRGAHGMQADVGLRGATFEQTLVLVDGVSMADPQTGHHALNLAIPLDDVERIEILRGHGSRLFGPNAFGGAINIITRRSAGRAVSVSATGGEHGLGIASASLSLPVGRTTHRIAVERARSDGYRPNTDFTGAAASWRTSIPAGAGRADVSLGFGDRDFGANGFYTGTPNEREHTRTWTASVGGEIPFGRISLAPRGSWRRNEDDFILDYANPARYRNRHTTDAAAVELAASARHALGESAFGIEAGFDGIASTNLGHRRRARGGLFVEHRVEPAARLTIVLGASGWRWSDAGWRFSPGIDLGVPIGRRARAYASVGRAFRVPTYTDLYYRDPANVGNPDLAPESAWSYEAGLAWTGPSLSADANAFRRDGRDLIDYVRNADTEPWGARNIARATTRGIELSATFRPRALFAGVPVDAVRAGYAFIDSDQSAPGWAQSKYLRAHLRHQATLGIAHALPFGVLASWTARREERIGEAAHVLVDGRVARRIGSIEVYVAGTNLLGASYRDVRTVPAPGRWLRAGIVARWKDGG